MQAHQIAATLLVAAALVPQTNAPPEHATSTMSAEVRHAELRIAGPPARAAAVAKGLNWSGYLANGGANMAAYTAVSAEFTQPRISPAACLPEADVSTWAGLGGFHLHGGRHLLVQAGTSVEHDIASGTQLWAWYQHLVTDDAGRQIGGGETTRLPVDIHAGDRIEVRVTVAGAAYLEVRNLTTDGRAFAAVPMPRGSFDGSTAEVIVERSVRLARFGSVRWHDVRVQRRDGSWHDMSAEPGLTAVQMLTGSRTISAPVPSPGGFTTHWRGCGGPL